MKAWWWLLAILQFVLSAESTISDVSDFNEQDDSILEDKKNLQHAFNPDELFTLKKKHLQKEIDKKVPKFYSWGGKRFTLFGDRKMIYGGEKKSPAFSSWGGKRNSPQDDTNSHPYNYETYDNENSSDGQDPEYDDGSYEKIDMYNNYNEDLDENGFDTLNEQKFCLEFPNLLDKPNINFNYKKRCIQKNKTIYPILSKKMENTNIHGNYVWEDQEPHELTDHINTDNKIPEFDTHEEMVLHLASIKRNSNQYNSKDPIKKINYRQNQDFSWHGKRIPAFSSWGGKRSQESVRYATKKVPAFSSWGGKRSSFSNQSNKYPFFPSMKHWNEEEKVIYPPLLNNDKSNKNKEDQNYETDQSAKSERYETNIIPNNNILDTENAEIEPSPSEIRKRAAFSSWGGKRPAFSSWGGKRDAAFSSWGGKRDAAFSSWGDKRDAAFSSWGGKRDAAFSSWGGKRDAAFSSWGGKRDAGFSSWGGKRDAAFSSWGGKRDAAFSSWGGKRDAAFSSWGGKRDLGACSWCNLGNLNASQEEQLDYNLQNNENENSKIKYREELEKNINKLTTSTKIPLFGYQILNSRTIPSIVPWDDIRRTLLSDWDDKIIEGRKVTNKNYNEYEPRNQYKFIYENEIEQNVHPQEVNILSKRAQAFHGWGGKRMLAFPNGNNKPEMFQNNSDIPLMPVYDRDNISKNSYNYMHEDNNMGNVNEKGTNQISSVVSKRSPAFNSWGGKRMTPLSSWDDKRGLAFSSWGGKRNDMFQDSGGKQTEITQDESIIPIMKNYNFYNEDPEAWAVEEQTEKYDHQPPVISKRAQAFNSWGGKRSAGFNSLGGKRMATFNSWSAKRAPVFNSWGGKRVPAFNSWGGKRTPAFNSWGGKRVPAFNSWGGKRAPAFNSWGGKRVPAFNSWGGKRAPAFNSWGGKRVPAFNSWGGKRAPAFNSWGGKRAVAFNSWGGKRAVAFNSWGGKRAHAFNSWGGKRVPAFNSWGGKRTLAFNSLNDKWEFHPSNNDKLGEILNNEEVKPPNNKSNPSDDLTWSWGSFSERENVHPEELSRLISEKTQFFNSLVEKRSQIFLGNNSYDKTNNSKRINQTNDNYRKYKQSMDHNILKNIIPPISKILKLYLENEGGEIEEGYSNWRGQTSKMNLRDGKETINENNINPQLNFNSHEIKTTRQTLRKRKNDNFYNQYKTFYKKIPTSNSWGGKRVPAFSSWGGKRSPGFFSWGGKRSKTLSDTESEMYDENEFDNDEIKNKRTLTEDQQQNSLNLFDQIVNLMNSLNRDKYTELAHWGGGNRTGIIPFRYNNHRETFTKDLIMMREDEYKDKENTIRMTRTNDLNQGKRVPAFYSWGGKRNTNYYSKNYLKNLHEGYEPETSTNDITRILAGDVPYLYDSTDHLQKREKRSAQDVAIWNEIKDAGPLCNYNKYTRILLNNGRKICSKITTDGTTDHGKNLKINNNFARETNNFININKLKDDTEEFVNKPRSGKPYESNNLQYKDVYTNIPDQVQTFKRNDNKLTLWDLNNANQKLSMGKQNENIKNLLNDNFILNTNFQDQFKSKLPAFKNDKTEPPTDYIALNKRNPYISPGNQIPTFYIKGGKKRPIFWSWAGKRNIDKNEINTQNLTKNDKDNNGHIWKRDVKDTKCSVKGEHNHDCKIFDYLITPRTERNVIKEVGIIESKIKQKKINNCDNVLYKMINGMISSSAMERSQRDPTNSVYQRMLFKGNGVKEVRWPVMRPNRRGAEFYSWGGKRSSL